MTLQLKCEYCGAIKPEVLDELRDAAAASPAAPMVDAHRCPHCGRRMVSQFDEDVGFWRECENCDYREAVSSVPAKPSGEAAQSAAREIARLPSTNFYNDQEEQVQAIERVITRHFAAAPVGESDDELVDEVQHRMDRVVEAAVEWHQAGREGAEWFEAAEKLGAAIDSLLELRGKLPNAPDMPHRWCSVHNREEFKYESLEHEARAAQSKGEDEG